MKDTILSVVYEDILWQCGGQVGESKTTDRETSSEAGTVVRARKENQNSSGEEDPDPRAIWEAELL